jgi:hypothetical protein
MTDTQKLANLVDDFMTDRLGMIRLAHTDLVEYALTYGDIQIKRGDFSGVAVAVEFGRKHATAQAERDAIEALNTRGWQAAARFKARSDRRPA